MLAVLKLFFSRSYWKYGFSLVRFGKAFFFVVGISWTLVEVVSFFSTSANEGLKKHWLLFFSLALFGAMWEVRPWRRISHLLKGRDVRVSIEVGDLFATESAIVIGSNRTFDTDMDSELISAASIQGQFTERYYDSAQHLDADLAAALRDVPSSLLPEKKVGKNQDYPIGTVARVQTRSRVAFFLAIASINNNGVARSSFEDLKQAMAALWQHVGEKESLCPIRIPVLGTGFSRITEPREEVIREILKSFVASCAEKRFCEDMTIVISPKDYREKEIDLEGLEEFLRYLCKFSEFKKATDSGGGTPLLG